MEIELQSVWPLVVWRKHFAWQLLSRKQCYLITKCDWCLCSTLAEYWMQGTYSHANVMPNIWQTLMFTWVYFTCNADTDILVAFPGFFSMKRLLLDWHWHNIGNVPNTVLRQCNLKALTRPIICARRLVLSNLLSEHMWVYSARIGLMLDYVRMLLIIYGSDLVWCKTLHI